MPDLTEQEAQRLFVDVSQALQSDDSTKLSDLLAQETPVVEEQPVEETPAEEPEEEEEEVEESTEPSDDDKEDKEDKSADEPADDKKKDDEDPLVALRAEIEELRKKQQTVSSQAGRVPSIQRRLEQYDKRLAELAQATPGQTTQKVKPKIEEALKELEETDPALAKTIATVMEQALGSVDEDSNAKEIERIKSLRDDEYADYVAEQRDILLDKYPNAVEVFASKHWKDWKAEQPKHIVELASSDSAEAVAMALDIYRRDMLEKYPELNKQEEQPKEEPVVNERAKQIEEERKKNQSQSVNLESGKSPAKSKEPADPEALFKAYSEKIRKEITGK